MKTAREEEKAKKLENNQKTMNKTLIICFYLSVQWYFGYSLLFDLRRCDDEYWDKIFASKCIDTKLITFKASNTEV